MRFRRRKPGVNVTADLQRDITPGFLRDKAVMRVPCLHEHTSAHAMSHANKPACPYGDIELKLGDGQRDDRDMVGKYSDRKSRRKKRYMGRKGCYSMPISGII